MPLITDAIEAILAWLPQQSISPALRELHVTALLPAAAYPQLTVLPRKERFAPHSADVTADLTLRLSCSAGRPADALGGAQSLAQQLRNALLESHGLGGLCKYLAVSAIHYPELAAPDSGNAAAAAVIAVAELDVELKYAQL